MRRIESEHCLFATEWIDFDLLGSTDVDDLACVLLIELLEVMSVRCDWKVEVVFLFIDTVKSLESCFSPDDETAWVTAGSELQKVQLCNISNGDTWEVAEGVSNRNLVRGVND